MNSLKIHLVPWIVSILRLPVLEVIIFICVLFAWADETSVPKQGKASRVEMVIQAAPR